MSLTESPEDSLAEPKESAPIESEKLLSTAQACSVVKGLLFDDALLTANEISRRAPGIKGAYAEAAEMLVDVGDLDRMVDSKGVVRYRIRPMAQLVDNFKDGKIRITVDFGYPAMQALDRMGGGGAGAAAFFLSMLLVVLIGFAVAYLRRGAI